MRTALVVILTMALIVTGSLVALDLAMVLGSASSLTAMQDSGNTDPADVRVVESFFDAANALLAGDDARALGAVVSPEVATHFDPDRQTLGHAAIAERWQAMQRQGDFRLSVVQLTGHGDDISALVEANGVLRPGLEQRDGQEPSLWRTIDRFRVAHGMIVEYWPGAVASRPLWPMPPLTISMPGDDPAVSLARLDFAPGAKQRALVTPFPQLLFVEAGMLSVAGDAALAVARAGDAEFTWRPAEPVAEEIHLLPGDALFAPAGTGQELANHEDRTASALSILIAPQSTIFGPRHRLTTTDMLTIVAMHDPERIGRRTDWTTGVSTKTLAVGELPGAGRAPVALKIEGDQVGLEPGAGTRTLSEAGLAFAFVQSGTLQLESGSPSNGATATPFAAAAETHPGSWLLRAGEAMAIDPGSHPTIANAGATRLELLLITVGAQEDD